MIHMLETRTIFSVFTCSSGIDDIVLSYMVGVLEELGSEDIAGDAFDLDGFIEMMDAYLPGFSNVNR